MTVKHDQVTGAEILEMVTDDRDDDPDSPGSGSSNSLDQIEQTETSCLLS